MEVSATALSGASWADSAAVEALWRNSTSSVHPPASIIRSRAALRAEIRRAEVGEWVERSEQRLDAYLAECDTDATTEPSTRASYLGTPACTSTSEPGRPLPGPMVDTWMRTPGNRSRRRARWSLARTVRSVFTVLRSAPQRCGHAGRLSESPTDRPHRRPRRRPGLLGCTPGRGRGRPSCEYRESIRAGDGAGAIEVLEGVRTG